MFESGGDAIRAHKDSFDILKSKDVRRLIEIVGKEESEMRSLVFHSLWTLEYLAICQPFSVRTRIRRRA